MGKTRRMFTQEFKAEAVKLVTERGRSVAEVARDLDLSEGLLRGWKRSLAEGGDHPSPGKGHSPAHELRRLRAEAKRLTMGRDVPEEATASFARESS